MRNAKRVRYRELKVLRMRIKFGEPCPICHTKVIKIDTETLNRIDEALTPQWVTVSPDQLQVKFSHVPICPVCDAAALKMACIEGHPLISESGRETQIKQAVDSVCVAHHAIRSEHVKSIESAKLEMQCAPLDDALPQAKILSFPVYRIPEIDWDEVGQIRKRRYPDLPVEIIDVIRATMTSTPRCKEIRSRDYCFNFDCCSADRYPPEPVPMIPGKACSVWMMDLLDRYGGQVAYGDMRVVVTRKKIRYPVFQVEPVSAEQFVGFNDCIEPYDSFIKTRRWKILTKALEPHNLVLLFARDLENEHRMFKGTFDANTHAIVRDRILEGNECLEDILLIRNGSA